jgi:hypothetical protein
MSVQKTNSATWNWPGGRGELTQNLEGNFRNLHHLPALGRLDTIVNGKQKSYALLPSSEGARRSLSGLEDTFGRMRVSGYPDASKLSVKGEKLDVFRVNYADINFAPGRFAWESDSYTPKLPPGVSVSF